MKLLRRLCLMLLVFIIASSSIVLGEANQDSGKGETALLKVASSDYWPKADWRRSTPEEQGMDSERLYEMFNNLQEMPSDIHSLLIVRNGYLISEAYFYPYQKDFKHVINSCTKSITSALMGIAIDEGCIKSTDEKVLPYFSDRKINAVDARKEALTLKHLLTMTTGLDWVESGSYSGPLDSWSQMWNSENQIQYILDRPMRSDPGKNFYYCTGGSHLLSGILQKATGKTAFEYGKEKFFGPLGITDIFWRSDEQGVNVGGAGLYMTPMDMSKFGYLFLQRGKWDERQVIPEPWIEESTQKKIDTPFGLAGKYGYGYQWWMNGFGGYSARGYGGQYIFVLPKYEMVIVFTSGLTAYDFFFPEMLVESYIIQAVKKPAGLKPNPNSCQKLANILKEINQGPQSQPTPKMPAIVKLISGKTFTMEDSSSFSLLFNKGKDCWLNLVENGMKYEIPVGLDGVFRIADIGKAGPLPDHNKAAFKGYWSNGKTFVIIRKGLADVDELKIYYMFGANQVTRSIYSKQSGTIIQEVRGIMGE